MNEHGDYLLFAGIFGLLSVGFFVGVMDIIGDAPRLTVLYVLPWVSMTAGGFFINKKDRQHK